MKYKNCSRCIRQAVTCAVVMLCIATHEDLSDFLDHMLLDIDAASVLT